MCLLMILNAPSVLHAEAGTQMNKQSDSLHDPISEPVTLEAVTIYGELQHKSIQEAQSSVVVLPGDELEQESGEDLYDLVEGLTNVNSVFGNKGYAIRGVSQYGIGGGSDDGTNGLINITLDGAAMPTVISTIYGPESTWDIQQIEVYRGAQSTQQGRNALTGSIYVKTMDPVFYDETKFRFSYGQNSNIRYAIAKNMPLKEERLAIRVAAEHAQDDGYVYNETLKEETYDAHDFDNIRFKLKALVTDNLSFVLGQHYSNRTGGSDLIQADEFPDRRISFSDARASQGSEHRITTLSAFYSFNDYLSLESVSTYYEHDFNRIEDTDYSAIEENLFLLETQDRSISQELKFNFNNERGFTGVVGLFYTEIDSYYDQDVTLPVSRVVGVDALSNVALPQAFLDVVASLAENALTINPLQSYDKLITNFAVYSELDYKFNSKWRASLGFRHDEEKLEQNGFARTTIFTKQFTNLSYDFLPASTDINNTRYDAFLPKVAIEYHFRPNKSVGLVAQKAYRAGGVQRNPISLQINEFDPEFTENYELVFRTQWLNGTVTFNANLFYSDWKEMQVPVFGNSGNQFDFDTVNAGEARLSGLECDLYAPIGKRTNLHLGIGYVDTEFTDFINQGVNLKGNEFAFAPKRSGNLGVAYYFSDSIDMNLKLTYQDEHFNSVTNDPRQSIPSRLLVGSSLTYHGAGWSFSLVADNLLDEDYETQYFDDNTQLLARVGDPRFVGVVYTLQYSG